MDDVMMGGCTDREGVYVCEDEYILSRFCWAWAAAAA